MDLTEAEDIKMRQIKKKKKKNYTNKIFMTQAVYCHPAYLSYMQSTSCEMLGWKKHKLEQDCWEKYQ